MSKIKLTLEFDGSILDFEDNMGMDENFDLVDSLIWLCDYGTKEDPSVYHNNIKITASKETFDAPYKESEDEQN